MDGPVHAYVIAFGSNMRVPGIGSPKQVIEAAVEALGEIDVQVLKTSRIVSSAPVGPSLRLYANAAALVETRLDPREMLDALQIIETQFGRRRRGLRWRSRSLDLDIVLWSGGVWFSPELAIPHPHFRERDFVLGPAAEVAPEWRDPVTGLTIRQLKHRLGRGVSRR